MMVTPEQKNRAIESILRSLIGWPGGSGRSLGDVIDLVQCDGNHIEIGSLFGATAVAAVWGKRLGGWQGKIYCIDPMKFDTHEYCVREDGNESQKILLKHQHQIFLDNVRQFPEIELVRASSNPWPLPDDIEVATIFIDGWHYGNGPITDAKNAIARAKKAVMLDDIIPAYPDIYRAFRWMVAESGWYLSRLTEFTAAFVPWPDVKPIREK